MVPQLFDGDDVGDGDDAALREGVLPDEVVAGAVLPEGATFGAAGADEGDPAPTAVCGSCALRPLLAGAPPAGEAPAAAASLLAPAPEAAAAPVPVPESGTEGAATSGGAGAATAAGDGGVSPACERLGTDDGETVPTIDAGAETGLDGDSVAESGLENRGGFDPSWTVGAGAAVGAVPLGSTP